MSNVIKAPIDNLQTLLSNSATFQSVVGEVTAAAAANHIYKAQAKDDGTQAMPRCVIGAVDRSITKRGSGSWSMTGNLFLQFEFPVPNAQQADPNAAHDWFLGKMEDIIEEMIVLVDGGTGYLNITEFVEEVAGLPDEVNLSEQGDDDATDITKSAEYWWSFWTVNPGGPAR